MWQKNGVISLNLNNQTASDTINSNIKLVPQWQHDLSADLMVTVLNRCFSIMFVFYDGNYQIMQLKSDKFSRPHSGSQWSVRQLFHVFCPAVTVYNELLTGAQHWGVCQCECGSRRRARRWMWRCWRTGAERKREEVLMSCVCSVCVVGGSVSASHHLLWAGSGWELLGDGRPGEGRLNDCVRTEGDTVREKQEWRL